MGRAQTSEVETLACMDDGVENLYLAQNFFDVEPESSRFDAGCGLVMLGDG